MAVCRRYHLFIFEGMGSLKNVLTVLQVFEAVSSLKINLSKYGLAGINMESSSLNKYVALVDCSMKECPFPYPGLHLGLVWLETRITLINTII